MGKIDEIWLAKWVCSSSKITKAALERAKGNDPQSVVHLVCYALNALPSLALPPECVDKVILSCALAERAKTVGQRLGKLTDTCISASGDIQWLTIGVYDIEFDQHERVKSFRH